MHEYAIISEIVSTVIQEAEKHGRLLAVEEVLLEVGELVFLNPEQLSFSFDVVKKDTVLEGAKLTIHAIKARVHCTHCNYDGKMDYAEEEGWHYRLPVFTCPECNMGIDIVEGKECIVKTIRLILDDDISEEGGTCSN